jgi:PRC-barrel domain
MRAQSMSLSVLIAILEIVSAHAKPCEVQEFINRMARLPPFIVVPAGSTFDDAIARALDCSLPPPPTFAGGERVELKEVVGQKVYTKDGKYIGSVAGLAVNPKTTETKSLVEMSFGTGSTQAAVPFQTLSLGEKQGFVIADFNLADAENKWPVGSNTQRFGKAAVVVASACFMCAYSGVVPIDITSDPSGGAIFVSGLQRGSTETKGVIKAGEETTIKIEYPKLKSCTFSDGSYNCPEATGLGYATFFCKLSP